MDNLKKYLQTHREELDIDEPGEHLWQAIQEKTTTPEKKKSIVIPFLRWTAAACILVLAGTGVFHLLNNKTAVAPTIASNDILPTKKDTSTATVLTKPEQPDTSPVISNNIEQKSVATAVKKEKKKEKSQPQQQINEQPENVELASFSDVINMQKTIINHTPLYAETPAYFSDFKTQLAQMDKDEIDIRRDIKKNGVSSIAVDQLINIYQQKITLLKKLQSEINKTNQRYKQSRSTDNTKPESTVHYMNI